MHVHAFYELGRKRTTIPDESKRTNRSRDAVISEIIRNFAAKRDKEMKFNYRLHEVAPYINWLYFFHTWGFSAQYSSVAKLHDCESCRAQWLASFSDGERPKAREAMQLYSDALTLLQRFDDQFETHALVALYRANSEGDDIILYTPTQPTRKTGGNDIATLRPKPWGEGMGLRLPMLRQQTGESCLSWADFILPFETGRQDTLGVFVTSVDEAMEQSFPDDDYRHLLSQTLADRLAEATAERMHQQVRTQIWGYAADEKLDVEDLFKERYVGRRPAVGFPSLPDQSINFIIDSLIGMSDIGVSLTESGAMRPHASTSGLLFSHPKARHFSIGIIGDDQLQDYAHRRGMSPAVMRRFLAANLPSC